MCGIVGATGEMWRLAAARMPHALAALHGRGPDDGAVWTGDRVVLGHRRLSVVDLSAAGRQPMLSADGRYAIAFNGEIYNFRAIRDQLGLPVGAWRSDTDSEVVLEAFRRWGEDCLQRFHGMFAFAIWDCRERRLFAARDRMGVKPFFYHHGDDGLAFASRPSALLALKPELGDEIDPQALRLYLEVGYVGAPASIHPRIRKLPPAHCLWLDEKGLRLRRFWSFQDIEPEAAWERRDENDLLDELEQLVLESVKLRMVSDVPLGAFLSGGIDSSLVVAALAKLSDQPIRTFTIGFDESRYDESAHAEAVARHLGTEHACERLRVADLLSLMPTFATAFDEPFFDSSAFPVMAVSRLARRHVTVALGGDGGDELFGGYHYYQLVQRLQPAFHLPGPLRRLGAGVLGRLPHHRAKLLGGFLRQRSIDAAFLFARSIQKDFESMLSPAVQASTQSMAASMAPVARSMPAGLHACERAMRFDGLFTLPDDYLQKVDLGSMAFSLESREPLLDHRLVEWAMRLPLCWKLRGRENKYLLRRLAYRWMPRQLLERPKQGFGVPIDSWLRHELRDWAWERLTDQSLLSRLPLRAEALRELFELHLKGGRNAHPLIWAVLMLLEYCRTTWSGHAAAEAEDVRAVIPLS